MFITTLTTFLPLLLYILFFLAYYFFLWLGLRLLKISSVTKRQMVMFIIGLTLFGWLTNFGLGYVLAVVPIIPVLYVISNLVSIVSLYIFIRWMLRLDGKQLWQLLAYLFVVGLLVSAGISFMQGSL